MKGICEVELEGVTEKMVQLDIEQGKSQILDESGDTAELRKSPYYKPER